MDTKNRYKSTVMGRNSLHLLSLPICINFWIFTNVLKFEIPLKQEVPIVVAIDEFQQIVHYPEKNTDFWLKGIFQQLNNVQFFFSGSSNHIMNDMFTNPGRPFFIHNFSTSYQSF